MDYYKVLELPLKTFWAFNRQVNRLRAEADMRQLSLISAGQSPEGSTQLFEQLRVELDSPTVTEMPFDEEKFKYLQEKLTEKAP